MSPRFAAVAAAGVLAVLAGLAASTPAPKRLEFNAPVALATDQIAVRVPRDPRYHAALRQGRAGRLPVARKKLERLALETKDPNTGAWSLYQAALAARASGDPTGHRRLIARLRREHPTHTLALRAAPWRVGGEAFGYQARFGEGDDDCLRLWAESPGVAAEPGGEAG